MARWPAVLLSVWLWPGLAIGQSEDPDLFPRILDSRFDTALDLADWRVESGPPTGATADVELIWSGVSGDPPGSLEVRVGHREPSSVPGVVRHTLHSDSTPTRSRRLGTMAIWGQCRRG